MSFDVLSYLNSFGFARLSEIVIVVYLSITLLFIVFHQTTLFKRNQTIANRTPYNNISSLIALFFIFGSPIITFELGYLYGYQSAIFIYWIVFFISVVLLFDALYWFRLRALKLFVKKSLANVFALYRVDEFDSADLGILPQSPTDEEKYSYIQRNNKFLLFFSIISFSAIQFSMFNFLSTNDLMWPLFFYFVLTIIYFLVSFTINITSKDFDLKQHKHIVKKWKSSLTESVDIFLPTAGESMDVLKNTWDGIRGVQHFYRGVITVYCLDDAARPEVKRLAEIYGFKYEVRPNRGWFKKAGNLRHGFGISKSTFIVIFDADFRPREDILQEMLPYFYENKKVGLVQSPQYFDVRSNQNWLQRGAGAVQELFYRVSQVSRQNHNASICVGSNAIYRRVALADTGGTALIEHSEDVHTGFNMRMHGWTLQYLPIVLAKGLCPGDMKAFFKQQYRWCLGSMTLLSSGKFWQTNISFSARLSYFSGFLYYIHTAVSSLFVPIIPLAILLLYPNQITLENYLLILPSIIFVQIIYPLWHRSTYGIEAWSTRMVYGWAHLFAISDAIVRRKMHWQATGAKLGKDSRYISFRMMQILFNFIPSILWIYLSAEQIVINKNLMFLPILLSGVYYYLISAKVTFYIPAPEKNISQSANDIWKIIPVGSFAYATVIVFTGLATILYSQSTKASFISPLAISKSVQNQQHKIENQQKIVIEDGAYIEVAQENDTLYLIAQRMLTTYSAESGDILTRKERNIIASRITERFSDKQLLVGDEISVFREELRMYVKESRKSLLSEKR